MRSSQSARARQPTACSKPRGDVPLAVERTPPGSAGPQIAPDACDAGVLSRRPAGTRSNSKSSPPVAACSAAGAPSARAAAPRSRSRPGRRGAGHVAASVAMPSDRSIIAGRPARPARAPRRARLWAEEGPPSSRQAPAASSAATPPAAPPSVPVTTTTSPAGHRRGRRAPRSVRPADDGHRDRQRRGRVTSPPAITVPVAARAPRPAMPSSSASRRAGSTPSAM